MKGKEEGKKTLQSRIHKSAWVIRIPVPVNPFRGSQTGFFLQIHHEVIVWTLPFTQTGCTLSPKHAFIHSFIICIFSVESQWAQILSREKLGRKTRGPPLMSVQVIYTLGEGKVTKALLYYNVYKRASFSYRTANSWRKAISFSQTAFLSDDMVFLQYIQGADFLINFFLYLTQTRCLHLIIQ